MSVFAFVSSFIGPIDGMCSRFSGEYNADELYGYLIFHILLRFFIAISLFFGIILSSSILSKMDIFYATAIFFGIFGMVINNLIYIINIGRGQNNWLINSIFVFPIFLKCIVLGFGYYAEITFRQIVILAELSQFLFCIITVYSALKNTRTGSSKINFKKKSILFLSELKNYGSNAFILIPISYIKTNLAPALAANNLNANDTFLIVFIQRIMDQVKSLLGRPNILTSGLNAFYSSKNNYFNSWIILGLFFFCITFYVETQSKSLPLFFVFIRITELCLFLSIYRIHAQYLKLQSFSSNRKYVFVPAVIFILALMVVDLSFYNFAWLYLFRASLVSLAFYLFSRKIRASI